MVCKATNFEGPLEANKPLENWSGEVKFTASQYFEPAPGASTSPSSGLDSLVLAVSMATAQGRHITPMGSRWSFENMVQTDDWAVSLAQIDRRLDYVIGADGTALTDAWRQRQLDAASTRRLLHVEAGIEVGALSEMLDANPGEPWALPTLGGANGQSLAGVISTSTHGGDWQQPPFPDLVRAIHLVTEGGRELWIEPASAAITEDARLRPVLPCPDTQIVRSDEVFNAALVSFGRFGVIYSVVLEVTRAFNIAEVVITAPREALMQALTDGTRAARPLDPLFALAAAPPLAPGLKVRDEVLEAGDPRFIQLIFNSQDTTTGWVQRRWVTTNTTPLNLPTGPGAFMPTLVLAGIAALNLGWAFGLDVGALVKTQFDSAFAKSISEGQRGPHHLLTSGTRAASHVKLSAGYSIEVIFDARNPNAVSFFKGALYEAKSFQQAGWISLRSVQPSRATLSMQNMPAELTYAMEFTTIKDAPQAQSWMFWLQSTALAHGGRLHWGQHNRLDPSWVWHHYGRKLREWHHALWQVSRDAGTFSNDFTRQRGLDPAHLREVQAVFRTPTGALTHLVAAPGAGWQLVSVRDAMLAIRNGSVMYVVRQGDRMVFLDVVNNPRAGGAYLRTTGDDSLANDLAALPLAAGPAPATMDDADFTTQSVPAGAVGGTQVTGTVVMVNSGTSVWERGAYLLVTKPGSGIQFPPVPLPQRTSPLQQAVFPIGFTAGAAGTRATLICRLMKDGRPFGAATDTVTIVFTNANEPAECEEIRASILGLEQHIAELQDLLDPNGPIKEQQAIRTQIGVANGSITTLQNRGKSLGCTLA